MLSRWTHQHVLSPVSLVPHLFAFSIVPFLWTSTDHGVGPKNSDLINAADRIDTTPFLAQIHIRFGVLLS